MLNDMKIGNKLFASFILMSAIGLFIGLAGIVSITRLSRLSGELNVIEEESKDVNSLVNAHYEWRQDITESVLTMTLFSGTQDSNACPLSAWLAEKRDTASDGIILSLLEEIREPHAVFHQNARHVNSDISGGNHISARNRLAESILPITGEVIEGLTMIETRYRELIYDKTGEIVDAGNRLTVLVISLIAFAFVAGLLLSWIIPPSITKPIAMLIEAMMKASDGDFSVTLPPVRGTEMGQLFDACNSMISYNAASMEFCAKLSVRIRELAGYLLTISSSLAENSNTLKRQTSDVSATAEEFSAGMTQTAESLGTASSHIHAVAASIEEINSTIANVASAAEETSARVNQSSTLVENIQASISKASGTLTHASGSFNSVAESVSDINNSISTISEHSTDAMKRMSEADEKAKDANNIIRQLDAAGRQISKIVSVISDIADQTNMLALNAAIEAASAGDAGRGFMVVANEVKELAKQTADATGEIADEIENVQNNMPEAVRAVSEISTIINGMSEFMNSLAEEIKQQGQRSDQIARDSSSAAREMSKISEEITKISENSLSVTKTVADSTKGVNEIAQSTAELVHGTKEIAMNSERASNNISEINRATKEMAGGVSDITGNIQLMDIEAGDFEESADLTKKYSEDLLSAAGDLEEFISRFKLS